MSHEILINVTPQETRVAMLEQGVVQELHIERSSARGLVGNIYVGRVARVLPGMQSAFVEIGLERAAFLHVATDLAAFAATAAAGALVLTTGRDRFDPIASLLVAVLLFWASAGLLRESTRIFMEGSPTEIDPVSVGRALAAHPHVVEVHDLHVWTVTSGFPALSAHVLVEQGADCHGLRRELESLLAERFELSHTTLQVDHAPEPRQPVELGTPFRREGPLGRR